MATGDPVFDALRRRYPDELVYPDEELQALCARARTLRDCAAALTGEFTDDAEAAFDELIPDERTAQALLPGVVTMLGRAPEEDAQVREGAARDCLAQWLASAGPDGDPQTLFSDDVLAGGVECFADAAGTQEQPGDMFGLFDSAVLLGMLRGLRCCAGVCFLAALPCAAVLLLAAFLRAGSVHAQEKLARDALRALRPEDAESADALRKQLESAIEHAPAQAGIEEGARLHEAQSATRENPARAFTAPGSGRTLNT